MGDRQSRVPRGVLTPVLRRSRRRGRLRRLAPLGVAVAAIAAVPVWLHVRGSRESIERTRAAAVGAVPAAARVVDKASVRQVRPPVLLTGPPLSRRALRPRISARAAIVVDAGTGRVLWALNARLRLPVASTTKIMTAYLALQRLSPQTVVSVPRAVARVPLVKEGLRPGERVRAWKLLDGLLMYSGNDDALTLAVAAAGTRAAFVAQMNDAAAELGLRDSHFSTPSGVIDADNYSSAWDLAALTRVSLRSPQFRRIVRTRVAHVRWSPPTFEKVYANKNPLLGRYRGANGVKTGWTTLAGHCLVASATRHRRTIIAVLLNDPNVDRDARRLLDLGFSTRS